MDQETIKRLKTGTTTVGVVAKDGVILAAERKATMGYLVASKDAEKIHQIDEHMGMTIAGLVGDAQTLIKYARAELKLYQLQEGKRISVNSAANLLANILYGKRFYPYYVQLVVGGYDTKPRLYSLGADGSLMDEKYYSSGSGSPMAFGVLETEFKEGMDIEAAKKVAYRSVLAATKRDIASGGSGIDVVVLDRKGYKKLSNEEIKVLAAD